MAKNDLLFKTLEEANNYIEAINGVGFPLVGNRNGVPSPETQQTLRWVDTYKQIKSNKLTVPTIPKERAIAMGISTASIEAVKEDARNNSLDYTGVNATLPALSVVGNKVKANGVDIHLKGVSLPEAGNDFANGWGVDYCKNGLGQFAGMNVVRVPCQPAYMENKYGIEPYLNSFVDSIVEWCESNSVYCIIDYHAIENWDTASIDTRLKAFWDIAAPRYKNLPHVLYEVFNEPITSTSLGNDWTDFKPTVQGWVNYVRALAPDNVILVPTPNWCQKVSEVPASPLVGSNLVYVEHIYPGQLPGGSRLDFNGDPVDDTTLEEKNTSLDGKFGDASGTIPVFISEWGYDLADDGFYLLNAKTRESFGEPLVDYMNTNGIHWTSWNFSHLSAPKMITNEDTFDLTDFGTLVKNNL